MGCKKLMCLQVQRLFHGANVLFAYHVDDVHLLQGWHRAVGFSIDWRMHAEATR